MIKFNTDHLFSLLKSFYTLTKLKVVVFDIDYKQVISYPINDCSFCSFINGKDEFIGKCSECVKFFCESCKAKKDLFISQCHVGLTEAVFPIIDNNDDVLGYIMFGQTSQLNSYNELIKHIKNTCKDVQIISPDTEKYLKEIKLKSLDEIVSASEILKTITGYIIMKQFIVKKTNYLLLDVNNYIEKHICENISVSDVCKSLFISKSTLYRVLKQEKCESLSKLIINKKIALTEKLLSTTNLSLNEIAKQSGFNDANYLSKVFKKKTGLIPTEYRKKYKQ